MITSTPDQKKRAPDRLINELEEAWELALAEASQRAQSAGRADIARYLDLRRRNDLLRRTATDWLNATFTALAADANRVSAGIQIERQEDHRFRRGPATMVGTQLTFRRGVRTLTIESGWPRTPRDGIVRGDGLACANIKHLGRTRMNDELVLIRSKTDSPQWFVLKDDQRSILNDTFLHRHFSFFTQS